MAKVKELPASLPSTRTKARGGILDRYRTWFSSELYKRNQGRKVRHVTFAGGLTVVALGTWRLLEQLQSSSGSSLVHYGIPAMLFALGLWFVFRLIHLPQFADFLIATEAEMNKVSWPTWADLRRATAVVLVVLTLMIVFLFAADIFWKFSLMWLGVRVA